MNAEIIITWYKGKPAGLWYNDAVIWETKEIIVDVNLLSTTVVLPLAEAVSFMTIFINEMASTTLAKLLSAIKIKIAELKELEKNYNSNDNSDNDNDHNNDGEIFDYTCEW